MTGRPWRLRFRTATMLLLVAAVSFGWLRYARNQTRELERLRERSATQEVLLDAYRKPAVWGAYGNTPTPSSSITAEEFLRKLKSANDVNALYKLLQHLPRSEHRAAIPLLTRLYDDGNEIQRGHAVLALGNIGNLDKASIAAMVRAADDPNWEVRCFALHTLGKAKLPTVKSIAMRKLRDDNPYVRVGAAKALCRIGEEANAVPTLIHLLQDDDPGVSQSAIEAFTFNKITPDAAAGAVPMLMNHLDSTNWEIRLEAIFGLYSVAPREDAVRILENAVNDPEKAVQQEAAKLLRKLVYVNN